MTYQFKIRFPITFFFLFITVFGYSQSLSKGLIFGKIELKNGNTLQGQIRWNNEQGLWEDVFNAVHLTSPVSDLLGKDSAEKLTSKPKEFDFDFMQLWEDKVPDSEPRFRCSFGNIAFLKSVKDHIVALGLKNGQTIQFNMDKSGDLDDRIFLFDIQLKRHVLYFRDIDRIDFTTFDTKHKMALGKPMYANVLTSKGTFKGFVSWDSEERFGNDNIDGKNKGKKHNYPLREIAQIKAQDDGSLITLKSGKNIYVEDHDDVDKGNRGIMVMGQEFGMVEVDWKNFISAKFESSNSPPMPYNDFKKVNLLKGTVVGKNGGKYTGQLIFNLHKMYDIEFLRGENNEFEYHVPFNRIDKIEPQNDKFSLVTLVNSSTLLLGEDDDVTDNNGGVIIKRRNGKPLYIDWDNIKMIQFE